VLSLLLSFPQPSGLDVEETLDIPGGSDPCLHINGMRNDLRMVLFCSIGRCVLWVSSGSSLVCRSHPIDQVSTVRRGNTSQDAYNRLSTSIASGSLGCCWSLLTGEGDCSLCLMGTLGRVGTEAGRGQLPVLGKFLVWAHNWGT